MPQSLDGLPELLNVHQVARQLDLSARTIWRYLARKQFPEPVRFSRAHVRWRRGDIGAYLDRLADSKPAECPPWA